jgi:SAM-dependent methyltransferase
MKTALQREIESRVGQGEIPVRSQSDLGSPIAAFDSGGRAVLMLLLDLGLCPSNMVLDLGCGALRIGYWLIRLLDVGHYCGIEPDARRLQIGKDHIVGPEILSHKKPRFDVNRNFNLSVFGEKFDFVLARSVWSHCSPRQILNTLDAVSDVLASDGMFIVSYMPAFNREKSVVKGVSGWPRVRHRKQWIAAECRRRGLKMISLLPKSDRDLQYTMASGQVWLCITKPGEPGPEPVSPLDGAAAAAPKATAHFHPRRPSRFLDRLLPARLKGFKIGSTSRGRGINP